MLPRLTGVLVLAGVSLFALTPSAFAARPKNVTPPKLSGTASDGSTLTATKGSWSPTGTTYAYAWQRCDSSSTCKAIKGHTKNKYVLQAADVNQRVRAVVKATNDDGTTSAKSPMTDMVTAVDPEPTPEPTPTATPSPTPTATPTATPSATPSPGDIVVKLPLSPSAKTINAQLSTQDVWNGAFS